MGGVYVDLFDDGIPRANPLSVPGAFEKNLADTARFQMLLAMLFGRPIVVPESWLVSSPLFLRLASEIMSAYPTTLKTTDSIGSIERRIGSPFIFALDSTSSKLASADRVAAGLLRRVQTNRRLIFSGTLSGAHGQEVARSTRASLAAVLQPALNKGALDESAVRALEDSMFRILAEGDGEELADASSASYRTMLLHLLSRRSCAVDFAEVRYRHAAAAQVELVERAVQAKPDALIPEPRPLHAFQAFFVRAREARVPFSDVMGMQKLLADDEPPVQALVEAFGRYVLGQFYAVALGCEHACASLDGYQRGTATPLAQGLLQRVLTLERRSQPWAVDDTDFVDMSLEREYDLDDTFDWPRVWQQVAAFAHSRRWKDRRRRLLNRFFGSSAAELRNDELWADLFDTVNGAMHDFIFRVDAGSPSPIVRMVRRGTEVAEKLPISDALKETGVLTEGSQGLIASAAIPGVAALLRTASRAVPTKPLLRLERGKRRLKSMVLVQRG